MTTQETQKLNEIKGFFADIDDTNQSAIFCVKQIINAIKITTGHCELRRLDAQEVHSDIQYWNNILDELEEQ